jgi:hypothetical protein
VSQPYAKQITAAWQKGVDSIVETGRLLVRAKHEMPYPEFQAMVAGELPFDKRTAERLMVIAEHPVISSATHVSRLPPSWGTLYDLVRLDKKHGEGTVLARIEDGTITPKTQRKHVAALLKDPLKPPKTEPTHANPRRKYFEFLKLLKPGDFRLELVYLCRAVASLDRGCTISITEESPEEVSSDSC